MSPSARSVLWPTALMVELVTFFVATSETASGAGRARASPVDIVIAVAAFLGPAAALIGVGVLPQLPLYWRRC